MTGLSDVLLRLMDEVSVVLVYTRLRQPVAEFYTVRMAQLDNVDNAGSVILPSEWVLLVERFIRLKIKL